MKLPLFFYFLVYWLVAIVINLIFKSLFGFINFNEAYGFLMLLIFSFDYITVFLLHKRISASLLAILTLILSLISVFLFMFFIWNKTGRESVLGHFILLFFNMNLLAVTLKIFWNRFKFEYFNHLLIILFYSIIASIFYYIVFMLFAVKGADKPLLQDVIVKQIAFIVPYPFIYKISQYLMKFLEVNFLTPTERIVIEEKPKKKE